MSKYVFVIYKGHHRMVISNIHNSDDFSVAKSLISGKILIVINGKGPSEFILMAQLQNYT